jgi:hypothetical protein
MCYTPSPPWCHWRPPCYYDPCQRPWPYYDSDY